MEDAGRFPCASSPASSAFRKPRPARGLSDAELDHLRQQLYGLADIAVTCYLTKRDKAASLPSEEPSG